MKVNGKLSYLTLINLINKQTNITFTHFASRKIAKGHFLFLLLKQIFCQCLESGTAQL